MERQELIDAVAGHLHAQQLFDAARLVLDWSGNKKSKPKSEADALEPVAALFYGLLHGGDYFNAAKLLWPKTLVTLEPRCTRMVWRAIEDHPLVFLQGSSSVSKTYGAGVRFMLDWLRDPVYTTVKVIGPSEAHLQENLFSHLVTLHTSSSIPLPGIVGDLFIGVDRRKRRGAISGTVVPLGKKGAGRLQGVKRFPRPTPHEIFGPLSRVRVLIDEVEKVPPGIWKDLDNIASTIEGDGVKVVASYNPEQVGSDTYQRAEPVKGWATFNIDTDEEWESSRGWHVVRLDAEKTENVMEGRVIYPGLQTREGLSKLAKTSGGIDSPGYQTFGRGAYPKQGTVLSIIPQALLTDFYAHVFWLEKPKLFAAVDSALEGGDPAMLATARFGPATGVKFAPTIRDPAGRIEMFKDKSGRPVTPSIAMVETLLQLERGETVFMAEQIIRILKSLGVDPSNALIDRTGNGAGVHDLAKVLWSAELCGLNYSEGSTHTKILAEDTDWCDDIYERAYSELWFALRKWREAGAIVLAQGIPAEPLTSQLTGRNYISGARRKVEPKPDYKQRNGGKSPNEADAITLVLHQIRKVTGYQPGLVILPETPSLRGEEPGSVCRVSVTDRMQYLD